MTAIVGVLNKHAIAVAADSAETVGAGVKIYNKANKIFTLSKHHPIGIAIYSSAMFNGLVPWEIIIKMFRSQLGNTKYNTVQEYADTFFKYLESYKDEYIERKDLDAVLSSEISHFWISEIIDKLPNSNPETGVDKDDVKALIHLLKDIKSKACQARKIDCFAGVNIAEFKSSISTTLLQPIVNQIVSVGGKSEDVSDLICETLFEVFSRECIQRKHYTGIVFLVTERRKFTQFCIRQWFSTALLGKFIGQKRRSTRCLIQSQTHLYARWLRPM